MITKIIKVTIDEKDNNMSRLRRIILKISSSENVQFIEDGTNKIIKGIKLNKSLAGLDRYELLALYFELLKKL